MISKGKVSKSAHSIHYRTLTKPDVQFSSIRCKLHSPVDAAAAAAAATAAICEL